MGTHITSEISDRLIEIVRHVAKVEILPRFRNLPLGEIDTKSSVFDLVTIADKAAEESISEEVRKLLPGVHVVGEEAVANDRSLLDSIGSEDLCVLVDPIDGTWNYANGLPLFGVMLAVIEEGLSTFGILYDPVTDAWLQASAGKGARYRSGTGDSRPVKIDQDRQVGMTGFVPINVFANDIREKLARILPSFERADSIRCSCHEYWLLAEGAVEFGISGMLNPWDHAAGELIYREAGGFAAMIKDGSSYQASMTSGQLLLARNRASWMAVRDKFGDMFS